MTFCQVKDQDVNILERTQSKYSEIRERNRHIVWLYKLTVTLIGWRMSMVKADAGDVAWIKEGLWLCWCCTDYFGPSLCVWLCSSQMNSDSDWTQSSNTATKASFNSSRKSNCRENSFTVSSHHRSTALLYPQSLPLSMSRKIKELRESERDEKEHLSSSYLNINNSHTALGHLI